MKRRLRKLGKVLAVVLAGAALLWGILPDHGSLVFSSAHRSHLSSAGFARANKDAADTGNELPLAPSPPSPPSGLHTSDLEQQVQKRNVQAAPYAHLPVIPAIPAAIATAGHDGAVPQRRQGPLSRAVALPAIPRAQPQADLSATVVSGQAARDAGAISEAHQKLLADQLQLQLRQLQQQQMQRQPGGLPHGAAEVASKTLREQPQALNNAVAAAAAAAPVISLPKFDGPLPPLKRAPGLDVFLDAVFYVRV
jgi:hypothetical protein